MLQIYYKMCFEFRHLRRSTTLVDLPILIEARMIGVYDFDKALSP